MSFTYKPILVTGAAGFIGFHLSEKLLKLGYPVVGLDIIDDYYDPKLKTDRLDILKQYEAFNFERIDLVNKEDLLNTFQAYEFEYVVNLAAQAGVRYSLEKPEAYVNSNIVGFVNLLEVAKEVKLKHLIYASSSSVYGANTSKPFKVTDNVDHPVSLYAATKKANELLAHTYSTNFGIPTTGLRFFSVYGPWGRPDMALFKFTRAIVEDKPLEVYNYGKMMRDFTYVDDVVEGIVRLLPIIPSGNEDWSSVEPDPSSSFAPYRIYNIGNNQPVKLLDFIEEIEINLDKKAIKKLMPIQKGDVPESYADCSSLIQEAGYAPNTNLKDGIKAFVDWYKDYYKVHA